MRAQSPSYNSKAYDRTIKTQIPADSPLPCRLLRAQYRIVQHSYYRDPYRQKNTNAILEIALTACSN